MQSPGCRQQTLSFIPTVMQYDSIFMCPNHMLLECSAPGHGLTSHVEVSTSPVTLVQLWPPWAAGVVTLNVLVIVPGPHDGEHSVKLDHEPMQSTEGDECYCQKKQRQRSCIVPARPRCAAYLGMA
jgi:hypothetical protein